MNLDQTKLRQALPTDVIARSGLARITIYPAVNQALPGSIAIGTRSVGWREEELESWTSQQVQRTAPAETSANPRTIAPSEIKKAVTP